MRRLVLLGAFVCFAAISSLAQWPPVPPDPPAQAAHVRHREAANPSVAPSRVSTLQTAPQQVTPQQGPTTPPQVTFRNGELSIIAQDSSLGDILRAVKNQTGATIDLPMSVTDRVVGNFGPGPARDVLSTLLNGSHFNYVLLGSAADPSALEHVILLVKSNAPETSPRETATVTPPAPAENPDFAPETDQSGSDEGNLFAEDPNSPTDDQAQNPLAQQPGARTPEQMLQDLQQRQQDALQRVQQRQQELGINPSMQLPHMIPVPGAQGQPAPQ